MYLGVNVEGLEAYEFPRLLTKIVVKVHMDESSIVMSLNHLIDHTEKTVLMLMAL